MSKFNQKRMVRTNIYLTNEQDKFLQDLSDKTGVKKSQHLRIALQKYIDNNEIKKRDITEVN